VTSQHARRIIVGGVSLHTSTDAAVGSVVPGAIQVTHMAFMMMMNVWRKNGMLGSLAGMGGRVVCVRMAPWKLMTPSGFRASIWQSWKVLLRKNWQMPMLPRARQMQSVFQASTSMEDPGRSAHVQAIGGLWDLCAAQINVMGMQVLGQQVMARLDATGVQQMIGE